MVGFAEELHNENEARTNALGHTERSTHRENKSGKGRLGALVVEGIGGGFEGVGFRIGTGFSQEQREVYWEARDQLVGRVVKYRHQPHGGKDLPRIPSFLGFRAEEDL